MKKIKSPCPQHLHDIHLIPPIADREKGGRHDNSCHKPRQIDKQYNDNPIVMSDGFKDFYADGTRRTATPVVYLDEWVKQGSKYATIYRKKYPKNTRWSASKGLQPASEAIRSPTYLRRFRDELQAIFYRDAIRKQHPATSPRFKQGRLRNEECL